MVNNDDLESGKAIRHDWIIFDTVDEAMEFFNDRFGEFTGYYA